MSFVRIAPWLLLAPLAGCGSVSPDHGPHDAFTDAHAGVLTDGGHGDEEDMAEAEGDMAKVPGPTKLSETGLYEDFGKKTLAAQVFRYDVRFPLWSDGSDKDRFLLLPPGATIDTADPDNWWFPVGTKVWKEFRRDGKRLETRLIQKVREGEGGWFEVSYVWNEDESEAAAAPEGLMKVRGYDHFVPSRDDCDKCHSGSLDAVLGLGVIQLSAPAGGPVPPDGSPLAKLTRAGLLSRPPAGDFEPPGEGVAKEALGYLHGNCGFCHSDVAPLAPRIPIRLQLLTTDSNLGETGAYATAIGTKAKHTLPPDGIITNIVRGAPEKSQLWLRMGRRDDFAMPPVGSLLPDPVGMKVVSDWITALPPK